MLGILSIYNKQQFTIIKHLNSINFRQNVLGTPQQQQLWYSSNSKNTNINLNRVNRKATKASPRSKAKSAANNFNEPIANNNNNLNNTAAAAATDIDLNFHCKTPEVNDFKIIKSSSSLPAEVVDIPTSDPPNNTINALTNHKINYKEFARSSVCPPCESKSAKIVKRTNVSKATVTPIDTTAVVNNFTTTSSESSIKQPSPTITTQIRSTSSATPPPTVSQTSSTPPPPPPPPPSSNKTNLIWLSVVGAAIGLGLAYYLHDSTAGDDKQKSVETKQEKIIRVPATSQEIPKSVPYLLIGGGTASFAAFRAIKSHNPKAKIMVISDEISMPYMRPPLSKELWLSNAIDLETYKFKQWNGSERSIFYEPDDFYMDSTKLMDNANGGVSIVRGYSVKHIDVCNRKAILTDGTEIQYEECLLAVGSQPKQLDVFSAASPRIRSKISSYKTTKDFEQLQKTLQNIKSVVVVGGGFLGSELSCALNTYGQSRDLKVQQIFHEKGNMGKVLPEYLSKWTTEQVRAEGVNVITDTQVTDVELTPNSQLKLKLMNGQQIITDHVVVAVGSEPNVALARDSNLEVDKELGGYVVNAELEARRHLYVAGDAACFYDPKLGRRRVEHHDHAVVSGRLAGENMVGLKKPYTHQSMFWSDLGPRLGYEAIGLVDSTLKTVGVFVKRDKPVEEVQKPSDLPAESAAVGNAVAQPTAAATEDDYSKGIVFYLRDDKVVGIVLWNLFNRINIARLIISENKKYDDLTEVAKLFDVQK